jgi:hypothetical protein
MVTKLAQNRSKLSVRMSAFALAAMALLTASSGVNAQAQCKKVGGHYEEHFVSAPDCPQNALCIAGEYRGDIQGDFFGIVASLNDTEVNEVKLFTSNSTIHARIDGKEGDLIIKNAGAFQGGGAGNIVDLQYIVNATGELAGATGAIRASGTFDFATGMGESAYEGMVCLP